MALNKLTTKHLADNTIKSAKIADGAITNAKISSIGLSKVGIAAEQPLISTLSISSKNAVDASNVTITGTNFQSIPLVQFQNTSSGARITASAVTYTSSTSITATFPAGEATGTYKAIVENPTGLSVRSADTISNN